ncbi:hypothetical protein, partial [Halorhabdus amylolytica]|uniref:hypothetical protein n=1 Tax=Halorhabdus amylolytica TaxID=2559573 RepID=UPI001B7D8A15
MIDMIGFFDGVPNSDIYNQLFYMIRPSTSPRKAVPRREPIAKTKSHDTPSITMQEPITLIAGETLVDMFPTTDGR